MSRNDERKQKLVSKNVVTKSLDTWTFVLFYRTINNAETVALRNVDKPDSGQFFDRRKMDGGLRGPYPSIISEQIENFNVDKWRRDRDVK